MTSVNSNFRLEEAPEPKVVVHDGKKPNKFIHALRSMFVWYPANYSAEERKLLFKLDITILIYGSLSYFIKTLDTKNVNNAYVSGMKEDLEMYGNELNWIQIAYQMGYVIGQVPFLLLLSRPRFSKWVLPVLEVLYGILTFLQSTVKNTGHLYALRFFVGFFESPTYAGTHYVLGTWYGNKSFRGNPPELFVRAATYFLSLSAGNLVSGHLQAAAYTNLSGIHGRTGWQWLFIIDGIMTLGVAIIGFVIWSGIPEAGKPILLTEKEYKLVFVRLKRFDIQKSKKITLNTFKRTLTDWKWYLFCFNYTIMVICWYPIGFFSLWLKQQGTYTVPQINQYPTVCDGIGVIVPFLGVSLAGSFPHYIFYTFGCLGVLIGAIIMSVYDVSHGAVFAAFYISYFINVTSPLLYSYVAVIMREDNEQRAIIVGSMMTFAQFIYIWLTFALFPTSAKNKARQAPQWSIGWPVSAALAGLMILSYGLITFLHEREKKLGTAFKNPDYINEYEDEDVENEDAENVESESIEIDSTSTTKRTVKESVKEVTQSD